MGEEGSSRSTVGWVLGAFGGRRLVGPKERRRPRRTHPHTQEAPQGTYNDSLPLTKAGSGSDQCLRLCAGPADPPLSDLLLPCAEPGAGGLGTTVHSESQSTDLPALIPGPRLWDILSLFSLHVVTRPWPLCLPAPDPIPGCSPSYRELMGRLAVGTLSRPAGALVPAAGGLGLRGPTTGAGRQAGPQGRTSQSTISRTTVQPATHRKPGSGPAGCPRLTPCWAQRS